MALSSRSSDPVTAHIVYWGTEGAGKRSSLRAVHEKLKADHRGPLRTVPTRLDPTVLYETFSIQVGNIAGAPTHLEIVAIPGEEGLEATRKQLLDQLDGIVIVLDAQADRLEDNLRSVSELRESLASYGQTLEDIPVVIQYNKRDLGEPFAIEALHRRIALPHAAVFETIATRSSGVLQALTTLSKSVIRAFQETNDASPIRPNSEGNAEGSESKLSARATLESAMLDEAPDLDDSDLTLQTARSAFEDTWPPIEQNLSEASTEPSKSGLHIVSVGIAQPIGSLGLRVPIVLSDAQGERTRFALTLSLEPLLGEDL